MNFLKFQKELNKQENEFTKLQSELWKNWKIQLSNWNMNLSKWSMDCIYQTETWTHQTKNDLIKLAIKVYLYRSRLVK